MDMLEDDKKIPIKHRQGCKNIITILNIGSSILGQCINCNSFLL